MNKKTIILSSLAVQLLILVLLATGSSLLTQPVFGGELPWGNLLTALLLTLFPINFIVIRRAGAVPAIPLRMFRACVYLAVVQGALWLFVSYALAGNWATNFKGGEKQQIWLYYTYITALLPFLGYFLMRVMSGFYKKA